MNKKLLIGTTLAVIIVLAGFSSVASSQSILSNKTTFMKMNNVPLLRDKSRSFPPKGEKNAFGVLPTQPRAIHPQAKAWGFLAHTMLKRNL